MALLENMLGSERARVLSVAGNLSRAREEQALALTELEEAHRTAIQAMERLDLASQPIKERSLAGLTSFFSNLTGQLAGLPSLL
jgi:hypothetical protein